MNILLIIILACALSSCSGGGGVCKKKTKNEGKPIQVGNINHQGVQGPLGAKGKPANNCKCTKLLKTYNQLHQSFKEYENQINAEAEELNRRLIAIKTKNWENCDMVASAGNTQSGVYNISVNGSKIEVYCEIVNSSQGWLVFQRRTSGVTAFYRNWAEYQNGFGNKSDNFWLGLENLHIITSSRSYQLRVDLEDFEGNTAYALYSLFSIGDESSNYRLTYGSYSGNAGNSMTFCYNQQFSTFDRDNDRAGVICAGERHGAWWYSSCSHSNLNGEYLTGGQVTVRGIRWYSWKNNWYSMKFAQMKIRPN